MERKLPVKSSMSETGSVVIPEVSKKTISEPVKKSVNTPIPAKPIVVEKKPVKDTQTSLRERLTNTQFEVTQNGATETPYKNAYWDNHEAGIYVDIIDGSPLFSSTDKFDSGTGWPSFTRPISTGVLLEKTDTKLDAERTEVVGKTSSSHLGHVFNDGPVEK